MTGQMTIWDFLPSTESLESIPEADMVKRIGDAIGVSFQPDRLGGYAAKIGKNILYCEYDRYSINDDDENGTGDLFIGVEFNGRDKYGRKFGAAAPRDSIQEAIEWFREKMTA